MTRTISTLVLGMGLLGGMLAPAAHAESYAYSTLNRDGSRTMYGRYGYTTLPASEFLHRNAGMNDYRDARYDSRYDSRYGSSRDWYSSRSIDSRYYQNYSSYDPSWSRGATLNRSNYRSVYDNQSDFRAPDRNSYDRCDNRRY